MLHSFTIFRLIFLCVQKHRVTGNVFQTQIFHNAIPSSTQVIGTKIARLIRKTAGVCFRGGLKGIFLSDLSERWHCICSGSL